MGGNRQRQPFASIAICYCSLGSILFLKMGMWAGCGATVSAVAVEVGLVGLSSGGEGGG